MTGGYEHHGVGATSCAASRLEIERGLQLHESCCCLHSLETHAPHSAKLSPWPLPSSSTAACSGSPHLMASAPPHIALGLLYRIEAGSVLRLPACGWIGMERSIKKPPEGGRIVKSSYRDRARRRDALHELARLSPQCLVFDAPPRVSE